MGVKKAYESMESWSANIMLCLHESFDSLPPHDWGGHSQTLESLAVQLF